MAGGSKMTKYLKGYKSIAVIQMLLCICYFLNLWSSPHGEIYGIVKFIFAGALFFGSILAYQAPRRWILSMLMVLMLIMAVFNIFWFVWQGTFITVGFPLVGYNVLYIIANLHFLGKLI